MSNLIQIKRSATTAVPASLNPGELAYSNSAQVIYIGSTDGASVVAIGGARNPGTLTANQALVANSTSGINSIQVGNVVMVGASQTINANGTVGTAGQVLVSGGTGANAYWSTPSTSVAGSNTYIQFNDSGSLNAISSFTFSKSTNTLTVGLGFTTNNTLTNTASLNVTGNTTIGGSLVVTGNVYAAGNTFLVNAVAITTNDKALYLANNQGTSLLADGSGIYVGNSATPIASFLYNNASLSFQSNIALTVSLGGNTATLNSIAVATGNATANMTANTTGFFINGSQPYQTTAGLSANVATLAANSATYLGNSSGTIANIASWITGNSATAYTNATSFASNASNINTGVLSYQYGGTSQTSYTLGDILVGNATSGVSKLSVGTNGYVLQSNGTTVVYSTLDGGSF